MYVYAFQVTFTEHVSSDTHENEMKGYEERHDREERMIKRFLAGH